MGLSMNNHYEPFIDHYSSRALSLSLSIAISGDQKSEGELPDY
jgi:hypothetical protein